MKDDRPLRILTIDNGGLQALSILEIVNHICKEISKADGVSEAKAPHEVFDIIAGIGTGGWLAILLGRYKLTVEQCMISYISIANDINPKRRRSDPASMQKDSSAISQDRLIDIVDRMIATHDLGKFMVDVDQQTSRATLPDSSKCHAFAVGAVKPADEATTQDYHLFRAYPPPVTAAHPGPVPQTCEVSKVCAATAAARSLLQECEIDNVVYWDNRFPLTHKVSSLALDEANALYPGRRLGVIVNVSPGLPTQNEIKKLRKAAASNTTTLKKAKNTVARARSAVEFRFISRQQPPPRSKSEDPHQPSHFIMARSDTGASAKSTSSTASQAEEGLQRVIRKRLNETRADEGGEAIYQRLALAPNGDKPYLDDIDNPEKSMKLVDEFLELEETKVIIQNIKDRCSGGKSARVVPELHVATDTFTVSPAASNRSSVSLAV